ncbi:MAG: 2-hydroxyacid dehydrogenase [Promethearchaeota archaeon]
MVKPKVYFTSNVFKEISRNPKVAEPIRKKINDAWEKLNSVALVEIHDGRFPPDGEIKEKILDPGVRFVGCHLSHAIREEWLEKSNVIAVSTSTMGYDHVGRAPGVLITHTPGVLQNAVADYTAALILSNLRNIVDLHDFVWSGSWVPGKKWDLDQDLSRALDNQVIGLIGLGEIGSEVARRLKPWNVKILYNDLHRKEQLESELGLEFRSSLEDIFAEADIVSLHVPLNSKTRGLINGSLLSRMKDHSLLVNTARGGIINHGDLLDLLEQGDIKINLAFDVHDPEPLDLATLNRYKKIKEDQPELRFIFMPHNASADADTRGKMAIMLLEDITWLVTSRGITDIKRCRIIPSQKRDLFDQGLIDDYRIKKYWEEVMK